jgi:hypothetical protein
LVGISAMPHGLGKAYQIKATSETNLDPKWSGWSRFATDAGKVLDILI